jgi:prepilin-type N-terminal cleavage/methylation domain-containing protein
MKSTPSTATLRLAKPHSRAFTLVEVMVATIIFAMGAMSVTAFFLQNIRYAAWQAKNVHVVNTSFGIADQIKNMGADAIYKAYLAADTTTPITLNVTTVDPTDLVDGYKTLALTINQKDTAITTGASTAVTTKLITTSWNNVTLKMGRLTGSPSIPVDYWITIRRNVSAPTTTPAFDILELTLIDRWSGSGISTKTLSQIQLSFPAPNCSF